MATASLELKRLPFLLELSPEQLASFQSRLTVVHAEPGVPIIREGDHGDRLFILAEGTVEIFERMTLKISRKNFEDRERTLVRLAADQGVFFGEMGLFEDVPRTANVVAVTECKLLTIDRAGFEAFAAVEPKAAYTILKAIARVLCDRLQRMSSDIKKLTTALSIAVR